MEINKAVELARYLEELLKPACVRTEIVGTVKRMDKPETHDIEILVIPDPSRPIPVFGDVKSVFDNRLEKLLEELRQEGILKQALDKKMGRNTRRWQSQKN